MKGVWRPGACPGTAYPIHAAAARRRPLLARVFKVRELVELHVIELAVFQTLDTAHVNRLDRIARYRIDFQRPPRAVDLQALEDIHRLVAIDLAVQTSRHLVHRRHAVPGTYRHDIGT